VIEKDCQTLPAKFSMSPVSTPKIWNKKLATPNLGMKPQRIPKATDPKTSRGASINYGYS
jgi:hypothetical protein